MNSENRMSIILFNYPQSEPMNLILNNSLPFIVVFFLSTQLLAFSPIDIDSKSFLSVDTIYSDSIQVVSINGFGVSFVDAADLASQSGQNPNNLTVEARKSNDQCNGDGKFDPIVMFCCDEIGAPFEVELRLCESQPNVNCSHIFVVIEVVDNLKPQFDFCPEDMDLFSMDYTDHQITGMPIAIDNCAVMPLEVNYSLDLDQNGNGTVVKTWIATDAEGLSTECIQTINVQADQQLEEINLKGRITDENFEPITNVSLRLQAPSLGIAEEIENHPMTGEYAFENIFLAPSYAINVEKSDQALNGVSTLDLVLIQKHLLGAQLLDSPYKMIAADADNNQDVSALDLIHFRKLILGQILELPNGQRPWRFVSQSNPFLDPSNPFPFNESIDLNDILSDVDNLDFVGVKIGDVNGDAFLMNLNQTAQNRNQDPVVINSIEQELISGGSQIDFYLDREIQMHGFQIKFEIESGKFNSLIPGIATIENANFVLRGKELIVSWNNLQALHTQSSDKLFSIIMEEGKNLSINDESLKAEIYDERLNSYALKLEKTNLTEIEDEIFSFNAFPNPFIDQFHLNIFLSESKLVDLQIYDNQGRCRYSKTFQGIKGFNEFEIASQDLPVGIYFGKIHTGGFTKGIKLIKK